MLKSKLPVSMRLGDTPVPIPNTMVKTQSADGTIPETVWESRWMPVHCFLGEDERKRSLRLENKHTLRSEAMVLLSSFFGKGL